MTQAITLYHSALPAQSSVLQYSPPLAQAATIHLSLPLLQAAAFHHSPTKPPMALQQNWGQGAGPDRLLSIDQGVQGSIRSQF